MRILSIITASIFIWKQRQTIPNFKFTAPYIKSYNEEKLVNISLGKLIDADSSFVEKSGLYNQIKYGKTHYSKLSIDSKPFENNTEIGFKVYSSYGQKGKMYNEFKSMKMVVSDQIHKNHSIHYSFEIFRKGNTVTSISEDGVIPKQSSKLANKYLSEILDRIYHEEISSPRGFKLTLSKLHEDLNHVKPKPKQPVKQEKKTKK